MFPQTSGTNYLYATLLHAFIGLILVYDALTSFPYHSKNVSKVYGFFAASYCWVNMVYIIEHFWVMT